MIISKFNRYVEKHGRVTYIVLGIIICFMFVIFVGNGNDSIGGCSRRRVGSVAKMYGKNISYEDFMHWKRQTDIACFMRFGMLLSQYNDPYLNRETFDRMRMVHEAKKRGYYKKVTDQEVAKKIHEMKWLQDDNGKFDLKKLENFKNGFLRSYQLQISDFDEIVRQDLAIGKMTEDVMKDVKVDEAEIDRELAEYTLKHAEIAIEMDKASAPTEKEIADFFANRKSDIEPDKLRSAMVATFTPDAAKAKAEAADAPADLKVSDEEALRHFNSNKDKQFKGKKFEEVKSRIVTTILNTKVRAYTRKVAEAFIASFKGAEVAPEAFKKAAEAAGAAVVQTGMLGEGAAIPGIDGEHPMLANSIRGLDKKGAVANAPVIDKLNFAVALLTDIKDAPLPETLDERTTEKIKNKIIEDKAIAFYNEKVAPYKEAAAGSKAAWELGRKQMEAVRDDSSKNDEQKQAAMLEINDYIRDYIQPFYVQEERAFSVAVFKDADFESSVTLSDADIEKGFAARKDEYSKVEARLSQILIKTSDADKDEEKAAKKAKAAEVLKKIAEGTDFAKLVAEYSDDAATKAKDGDTGLVSIDSLDHHVKEQVEKMQVGQISPVVESHDGLVVFKLVEKTAPKTLDDVKPELVKALTQEAARKAANAEAERLASAVAVAWNESGHKDEQKLSILKSHAQDGKAAIEEVGFSKQYNYSAKGPAGDTALMSTVFATTTAEPFTKAVEGNGASYVACLTDVKPAKLDDAKNRISTTINVYKRDVATKAALDKANAEIAAINKALKDGSDIEKASPERKFEDAKGKLSKATERQFNEIMVRNSGLLLEALSKAEANTVIPPQKTYSGYALVYLAAKDVPTGDDAKDKREATRNQLLTQKKNQVLADFVRQAQKDSNTQNINPMISGLDDNF